MKQDFQFQLDEFLASNVSNRIQSIEQKLEMLNFQSIVDQKNNLGGQPSETLYHTVKK